MMSLHSKPTYMQGPGELISSMATFPGASFTGSWTDSLVCAGFVIDEALEPRKISTTTFGLKGSWDVDGSVYAQVCLKP